MKYKVFFLFFVSILLQGCTLFGAVNVEEPEYTLVLSEEPFEVRQYPEMTLVETTVNDEFDEAGDEAFRRLFDYIRGDNGDSAKIEMTAPVIMDAPGGEEPRPFLGERMEAGWKMSFVLPDDLKTNPPEPKSEMVSLTKLPPKRYAIVSFTGSWNQENFNKHSELLSQWLKSKSFKAVSDPQAAAYNPPWAIPALRRNEVLIEIE